MKRCLFGPPTWMLVLFMALSSFAWAESPAQTQGQPQQATPQASHLGAWVVTEAAAPADVGLYVYFSPDGTFLMVDPRKPAGAAGSYVIGRAGLMVTLYGQGASSMFLIGDVDVKGDVMTIDNKGPAVLPPQKVILRRMVLQ